VSEPFYGLEEINIRNLGVIESAEISFKPGLNVLTGETGAGKTMVLTALSLILGGKSESEKVRTGSERMIASGRFAIPVRIGEQLEDLGAEIEEGSLLITRTVTTEGKSRITVGGAPATAGRVSELASDLVEVHAQSSTNRLTKPTYVRSTLDAFGGHATLLEKVAELHSQYQEMSERIAQLKRDQANRESEISKLSEFMKAFNLVTPQVGEIAEIEAELTRLSSVDELQQAVSAALNFSDAEDFSITSALVSAKRALDHASGKDASLDSLAEELGDSLYSIQEIVGALHRYLAALDADPSRLEFLQERKSAINSLIKKYGEGSDRELAYLGLISRAAESGARISDLEGGGARISDLEVELGAIYSQLLSASQKLSQARQKAATILQEKISHELRSLALLHSAVLIEVNPRSGESPSDCTPFGLDEVALLFTSHEGATPGPIHKVASGGELSRVMLAIEVVLAGVNPVPTYIFDEVDAGVGGKAAIEVGRRLQALAREAQVIVVTHLAQVAVWADNHLVVRKSEGGKVSISDVIALTEEERSVEIARMLSGQEESSTAREHAKELLEMVRESVIN
jgi:DNA repair protein RecN (Recombination protein N)